MSKPNEELDALYQDAKKEGVDLFASIRGGAIIEISSCSMTEGPNNQISPAISGVLAKLCKLADAHGLYLAVTPEPLPNERNGKRKLEDYYKNFGFQKNHTARIARYETQCSYIRRPAGK